MISDQSLLLSTIVLNDYNTLLCIATTYITLLAYLPHCTRMRNKITSREMKILFSNYPRTPVHTTSRIRTIQ